MAEQRPSTIRFFAPEHPALAHTVRSKLEKRRAELATQISDGFANDWANYRERVGIIKGIDEAIQFCIEAENNLTGD